MDVPLHDEEQVDTELAPLSREHLLRPGNQSSSNNNGFASVPLSDDQQDLDLTHLSRSPDGPSDDSYDPVLSNSLHSSLTGHHPSQLPKSSFQQKVERARYWWNDQENTSSVRIIKCVVFSLLLLIVIIIVTSVTHHSSSNSDPIVYPVRLPTTVIPHEYTMALNVSIPATYFAGDLLIKLDITEETSTILLHQIDLKPTDIWISYDSGVTQIKPISHGDTQQYDLYAITWSGRLKTCTNCLLHIHFSGRLLPTLAGFYISTYTSNSGHKRTIASTMFEPTDARRAFPCFDEPAMKANFTLSIVTDDVIDSRTQLVLANTALISKITVASGKTQWSFLTTPRMSTYLLAYSINDFSYRELNTSRDLPVRVYTTEDKIGYVDIALRAGVNAIEKYESYFGLEFPLSKSDMIGIPNFPVGAMENWGLVAYRETALLIDPISTEAGSEQNIILTIAHELAHQWFGDIVTMEWWNDLWLNEGFASYIEWMGIYDKHTTWDTQSQLILDAPITAMISDASQYSHPIVQEVENPDEVNSLFDSISYKKGSSVILQLENIMTSPAFQKGLQQYLTQHAYGNARSEDLWSALQANLPSSMKSFDITSFMNKFTTQMGYPVVTVTCDPVASTYTLTQSRFLILPYSYQDQSLRDQQSTYKWDLHITSSTNTIPTIDPFWFYSTNDSITSSWPAGDKYVLLNILRTGYYRVNYPDTWWQAIANDLITPNGEPRESRPSLIGLIDDVWALAYSNLTHYNNAFDMLQFLGKNYTEYAPWRVTADVLGRVHRLLITYPDDLQRFEKYVVEKLIHDNDYSILPWNGYGNTDADHLQNMLQSLFVGFLVGYNSTSARREADLMFQGYMMNGTQIANVNIRDSIYRVGVEEGDESCFQFMYNQYRNPAAWKGDPIEQRRLLRSLSRTLNTTLLSQLLDWSVDPAKIPTQDTTRIIIYVSQNKMGQQLTWNWIKKNWDTLFTLFAAQSFTLPELFARIIGEFTTQALLDDALEFFKTHQVGTAKRALAQAEESAIANIYWLNERYSEFSQALRTRIP